MTEKIARQVISEVYPLVWSNDVGGIADWAVNTLGLSEAWRAVEDSGLVEHAELTWPGGRISLNIHHGGSQDMGPAGISLRVDDPERVQAVYKKAVSAGARIVQGPETTRVAYSFTAVDPEGNQWWVNAETGFLDEIRQGQKPPA